MRKALNVRKTLTVVGMFRLNTAGVGRTHGVLTVRRRPDAAALRGAIRRTAAAKEIIPLGPMLGHYRRLLAHTWQDPYLINPISPVMC